MLRGNKILAVALTAAIAVGSIGFNPVKADANTKYEDIFTDDIFCEWVKTNYDDGNGIIDDAELKAIQSAQEMDVSNLNISSLAGIEKFVSLTKLDCSNNRLAVLDVTSLTKLEQLNCSHTIIHELDLSKNTMLGALDCSGNCIRSLDISQNKQLPYFDMDVTSNDSFDTDDISIKYNIYFRATSCVFIVDTLTQVTPTRYDILFPDESFCRVVKGKYDADKDGFVSTDEMDAIANESELDVSYQGIYDMTGIEYFTNISSLYCIGNNIGILDITYNTKLPYHDSSIQMQQEDVLNNGLVYYYFWKKDDENILYVDEKTSTNIKINSYASMFPDENFCSYVMRSFDLNSDMCCSQDELDLIKSTATLNIQGVSIRDFTGIEYFTGLKSLECSRNYAGYLDVSALTELQKLICTFCSLISIDVTKNTKLVYLDANSNYLTDIKLNDGIESINLECNRFTSFDISKYTELSTAWLSANDLSEINIANNTKLPYFDENAQYNKQANIYGWPGEACIWTNGDDLFSVNDGVTIIDKNPEPTPSGEKPNGGTPNGGTPVPTNVTPTTTVAPSGSPAGTPGNTPETSPTPTEEVKNVGDFVTRCYQVAFNRTPDKDGFDSWVDKLTNGQACGVQVGYGFIFSDEYSNKNTTDDQFVKDLYKMFFDREPDEAGYDYWMNQLKANVNRIEVFAGFANSLEFFNLCSEYDVVAGSFVVGISNEQQGGVNCYVARLYRICLGRLPDMGSQSEWVQKLLKGNENGTSVAQKFVFSPEFLGKEPSNSEFVNYMYEAFFGREADETGFDYWVDILNTGGTYEDVFAGFTGSPEFFNLCGSYGINV